MHENQYTSKTGSQRSGGPRLRASVARTADSLQRDLLHSPNHAKQAHARAVLATLRKYSAVKLKHHPLALEEVLLLLEPPLSELELGRGDKPSASELAAFQALTMLGVHMQSATTDAHIAGQSFAKACGRFYSQSQSQSTKPRFDAMMVAQDEASRMVHIRSLVTLLRRAKLGFDYGQFANDLRVLGDKTVTQKEQAHRQGVLLRWGRDFATGVYASSSNESES